MRNGVLIAAGAFALAVAVSVLLPGQRVPPALAQSVLPDAGVDWQALGRVDNTQLIYLEFPDGSRCLASDGGAGEIDCDWRGAQ